MLSFESGVNWAGVEANAGFRNFIARGSTERTVISSSPCARILCPSGLKRSSRSQALADSPSLNIPSDEAVISANVIVARCIKPFILRHQLCPRSRDKNPQSDHSTKRA